MNARKLIPVLAFALPFWLSSAKVSAFSDDDWKAINQDGIATTDGAIEAIAYGKGVVYVAGHFTVAGEAKANNVARWDGRRWDALDSGLNGPVHLLYFGKDGNLYASGDFTASGLTPCRSIAVWNGGQWKSLGEGLDKPATFVSMDGRGNLYAAGPFSLLHRYGLRNFGIWSGGKWDTLPEFPAVLECLAGSDTVGLYASGDFSTYVFKNNAWTSIGFISGHYGIVPDPKQQGAFYLNHGTALSRYDGSSWKNVIQEVQGVIRTVAVDTAGRAYFAGRFNAVKKDSSFQSVASISDTIASPLAEGFDDTVTALVAGDSGRLYARGVFHRAGKKEHPQIAQWDGKQWGGFGPGMDGNVEAMATAGNGDVYIGGRFTAVGGIAARHIAKWDGRAWSAVGQGLEAADLPLESKLIGSIVCGKDGMVYVGGEFQSAGGKPIKNLARWNGTDWDSLPSGDVPVAQFGVRAMAFGNEGSLYVAGRFGSGVGANRKPLAKWNGATLQLVDADTSKPTWVESFNALTFDSKGNMFVAGRFTIIDSVPSPGIIKWNGTRWIGLDSGFYGMNTNSSNQVNALTCVKDTVYIGGSFSQTADGRTRFQNVAFWDGSKMKSVGKGVEGDVYSLVHDSLGRIYAGGAFITASGTIVNNIACWNGAKWLNLGAGTDGRILTLGLSGSTLYIGGGFSTAGRRVSPYVAAADIHAVPVEAQRLSPDLPDKGMDIRYHLTGSKLYLANVRSHDIISVYSLSGRKWFTGKGCSLIDLSAVPELVLTLSIQREGAEGRSTTCFSILQGGLK